MTELKTYSIYHKFIETYLPSGFKGIDRNDPFMLELEAFSEASNQFFYISDIIRLEVIFTSRRSYQMIGIHSDELSPYHFMEVTHPDDIQRLNLGRARLIRIAQDLYIAEKGYNIVSTNFRMRVPSGEYSDFLIQCYLFYTTIPYKTVFFLKIHTNIDWHKKIKHGYHHFMGDDLSYFRYPDEELLQKGNIFSEREFGIIRMIESGMDSDQIAAKLFISVHTVNTHRRNILEKSGKSTMAELIYDLIARGVL